MKIKLSCALSGPDVSYAHGAVVDLPDDEAQRLVDAGLAVTVLAEAVPEILEPVSEVPAGQPVPEVPAPVVETASAPAAEVPAGE